MDLLNGASKMTRLLYFRESTSRGSNILYSLDTTYKLPMSFEYWSNKFPVAVSPLSVYKYNAQDVLTIVKLSGQSKNMAGKSPSYVRMLSGALHLHTFMSIENLCIGLKCWSTSVSNTSRAWSTSDLVPLLMWVIRAPITSCIMLYTK